LINEKVNLILKKNRIMQLTIDVKDSKSEFVKELLGYLKFVKIIDVEEPVTKNSKKKLKETNKKRK
jgi:hypothetical protein